MKIVIRLTKSEEVKALPILLRHSAGVVLENRTYVLDSAAVEALRGAQVRFEELGAEAEAPSLAGATSGARV